MKYRQQVDEERMYTVDCEVEADSPEEAKRLILAGEYHELDEQYHETRGRDLSGEMTEVDDSDEARPFTDAEFKELVGTLDVITLTRLGMRRAFATIKAIKKKCNDAQCLGAELIAEGSAEWEERANNAERDLKDLRERLKDAVDTLNRTHVQLSARLAVKALTEELKQEEAR